MIWNGWACEDELHEAFQEVMWKPWLTVDRGDINVDAFIGEIVDAMHFLGNLLLCVAPVHVDQIEVPMTGDLEPWRTIPGEQTVDTDLLAQKLWLAYQAKAEKNLQRQRDGYDGRSSKCSHCRRELIRGDDMSTEPDYCIEHGVVK